MASSLVIWGWLVVAAYMAVILVFVVRGARRNRSLDDYALGSISFSPVAVGLALAASMTSAATFIINPGFVALYGLSGVISYALVLPAAALVSLIVLTKGFRKHGQTVKALTMAQWMGSRYGSRGLSLFFAVLSLLLITFIVLIVVGLVKVLSKTLDVGELPVLLGVVAFVFGYMMFGGANSMVYTNTVQAVLMLVVAFILLGSGYEHFADGVRGFLDRLRAVDPALTGATNTGSFLFRDWFEIGVAQVIVGVAIVCQPHIITKSLLLKTDRDVNRYLVVGIVTEAIFFAVVIAGLYARLAMPDLTVDGQPLKMDRHHLSLRGAGVSRLRGAAGGHGPDLGGAVHPGGSDPVPGHDHHRRPGHAPGRQPVAGRRGRAHAHAAGDQQGRHRRAGGGGCLAVLAPARAPQAVSGHLCPERRLRLLLGGVRAHPVRDVPVTHDLARGGGRGCDRDHRPLLHVLRQAAGAGHPGHR